MTLIDDIVSGSAILLSADDICQRLSISRSTFDRWVKNGQPIKEMIAEFRRDKDKNLSRAGKLLNHMQRSDIDRSITSFPPPDIRIGGSPRWSADTLKKWLSLNVSE
ncbi:hypothetical protein [Thalassospira tepidiphila]|uniref:helix-turn-helix transcriptional regulator n=1 Tax=Thalassospira tepidiphila TaxID=393657 RepID=UPI0030C68B4C